MKITNISHATLLIEVDGIKIVSFIEEALAVAEYKSY